jgi:hypothetical protein
LVGGNTFVARKTAFRLTNPLSERLSARKDLAGGKHSDATRGVMHESTAASILELVEASSAIFEVCLCVH